MSRINATTITGLSGAAPTFTNGAVVTGVVTATSFIGAVTGGVTGDVTGNLTGNITGNVTGNINSTGVSTITRLSSTSITGSSISVTGISTFQSTTLIGAAASTGTASQPLQVTGGAYISGNTGIGTTTPAVTLDVIGGIKGTITSGTAQATTSGTSIDFTGIPSWVKRITVMFNGVSTNGTSPVEVRIGSATVSTSGYSSISNYGGSALQYLYSSTGFTLDTVGTAFAAAVRSGALVLTLIGSNTWVGTGSVTETGQSCSFSGNSPALSGTLDRVRITTVNGTDTFDAGSVNILYEG